MSCIVNFSLSANFNLAFRITLLRSLASQGQNYSNLSLQNVKRHYEHLLNIIYHNLLHAQSGDMNIYAAHLFSPVILKGFQLFKRTVLSPVMEQRGELQCLAISPSVMCSG